MSCGLCHGCCTVICTVPRVYVLQVPALLSALFFFREGEMIFVVDKRLCASPTAALRSKVYNGMRLIGNPSKLFLG